MFNFKRAHEITRDLTRGYSKEEISYRATFYLVCRWMAKGGDKVNSIEDLNSIPSIEKVSNENINNENISKISRKEYDDIGDGISVVMSFAQEMLRKVEKDRENWVSSLKKRPEIEGNWIDYKNNADLTFYYSIIDGYVVFKNGQSFYETLLTEEEFTSYVLQGKKVPSEKWDEWDETR